MEFYLHVPIRPHDVVLYRVITNDVSDYINLLVRIAYIICNHSIFLIPLE
jgi:hypothetical protein